MRFPELLFFSLAAIVALVCYLRFWSGMIDSLRAESYVPVPCDIVQSEKQFSQGVTNSWTIRLEYRYVVDGVDRTGRRFGFYNEISSRSPYRLPTLPSVGPDTCYVRRGHPTDAVLRKYVDASGWPLALGTLAGTLFFVYAGFAFRWVRRRNERRSAARAASAAGALVIASFACAQASDAVAWDGLARELKPARDASVALAVFTCTNVSQQRVHLSVKSSCSCTTPTVDQPDLEPGASTTVAMDFPTGFKAGRVTYTYTPVIDGAEADEAQRLHVTVEYTPLFRPEAVTATWTVGDEAVEKELLIHVIEPDRVHVAEAHADEHKATGTVEIRDDGRLLIVRLKPTSTDAPGLYPVRITTDHPIASRSAQNVYVWVVPPKPTH